MLKPIFPPKDDLFSFVYMTHTKERIDLKMAEIQSTFLNKSTNKGKQSLRVMNPYADGHFQALGYAWNQLIDKDHFPGKPTALVTIQKSDTALFWLRELHKQMSQPLANLPVALEYEDPNVVFPSSLGRYRQKDVALTSVMAPHPQLIKNLLHGWINDVASVNERLYPKAVQLYALKKNEAEELVKTAHLATILFSCVQPFQSGNNRIGRILENILRLQWRLPWKHITENTYQDFILEVNEFQVTELPRLVNIAMAIRC
jgi:hypothetical protein